MSMSENAQQTNYCWQHIYTTSTSHFHEHKSVEMNLKDDEIIVSEDFSQNYESKCKRHILGTWSS